MHRRGLAPGDRYMTAAEAGRLFNVSRATADAAMSVLSDRRLLVRRRSQGSFGGPELKPPTTVGTATIYALTRAESSETIVSTAAHQMICGIRQAIGDTTNVQFCFLPEGEELNHLSQLMKSAQASPGRFGVIAASCARHVYQYLIDNAIPSVVLGTTYPGQDELPSIDSDHIQVGRLLMDYVIRRGHQQAALLTLTNYLPGDNQFLSGIHDVMSEAGRLPNSLTVRLVPRDPADIEAEIQDLLSRPDGPTAVMTLSERVARIAIDAASRMGRAVPDDVEVLFTRRTGDEQHVKHAYVRRNIDPLQTSRQAATMIDRMWQGLPLDQKRVVMHAELFEQNSD